MHRCAFLTLADPTGYRIDDHLAAESLEDAGWLVETIPWNAPGHDWSRFDAVVVRSTWDYHKQVDAFFSVLEDIRATGPRLFNDLDVMRWNADKRYLADLAEKGVEVVPTIFGHSLEAGDHNHFCEILESGNLVIKPVRGANAEGAFRLKRKSRVQEEVLSRYASDDFMVQPFMSSILEQGEVSLFYFGGAFSHAIRKIPRPGDFRVQEEHGGTIVPWQPDREVLAAGDQVLKALEEQWPGRELLYARVDFVRSQGQSVWWLMELEVIEPSLYFRMDEGAPGRFTQALQSIVDE